MTENKQYNIILDEVNSANEMENGKHRKRKKMKRSRTVEESVDSDEETCTPFTSVNNKHEVTSLTENIVNQTNSEIEKKKRKRKKEKKSRNEEDFIDCKTFTPENNIHEETSSTENIILDDVNSVSDSEDGNKYSKRKKKKKHKTMEETDKQALKPPTDKFPLDTMNSEDGKKSSKRKKKKKSKTKEFIDSSSLNEHHEATSLTEGAPADVNVVDTYKNVMVKKPIIPLWVPDEVSEIIHGSNRVTETLTRNSDYLLHNLGIRVRKGFWTPEEDRILKKNYKRALKDICKDDHQYILYVTSESPAHLQKRIRDIIRETLFYSKLGKNLNRTPKSCLRRAKYIFQQYKVSGRFTEEEKQELERLVDKYGPKWRKIGRMMGRSADSVSAFYYQIRSKGGKGRFSDLERQQLREAVEDVMKKHNIPSDQYRHLPWAEIASKVPTRTVCQCKKHWLFRIHDDDKKRKRVFGKIENKRLFVKLINEVEVAHEFDIDWSEIAKKFGNKMTPKYLQTYWNKLKRQYVPDFYTMSFDEVRECLYKKYSCLPTK